MGDEENRGYIQPPAPPQMTWGGSVGGPNPKRWSEDELDQAAERKRRKSSTRRPWWRRLFRRGE